MSITCGVCGWDHLGNPKIIWDVIDVDLAHVFQAETIAGRDAFVSAIELMGHRVFVKEITI